MTPEQIERIVNADTATMMVVSGLISFLVKKGVMDEDEVMSYLRRYVDIGTMDSSLREAAVRKVELLLGKAF